MAIVIVRNNCGEFLSEYIESVRNQTRLLEEILVVDRAFTQTMRDSGFVHKVDWESICKHGVEAEPTVVRSNEPLAEGPL
jgi:hypothetical protein